MLRYFAFLAIFCVGPLAASPPRATHDWAALDKLVDAYDKADAPGISLAVSIDGQTVYHRWKGQADLARDVPIDADTRFDIASVSKQFTAFAIMMLVDAGELTLEQDVRELIPELEVRSPPVTIRHLLNHTSGLREANSLLQLIGMLGREPLFGARGEREHVNALLGADFAPQRRRGGDPLREPVEDSDTDGRRSVKLERCEKRHCIGGPFASGLRVLLLERVD